MDQEQRNKLATNLFLEKLGRLDKDARLEITGTVDNNTRSGVYVNIKSGLSNTTYFVGKDKTMEPPANIAEFVN